MSRLTGRPTGRPTKLDLVLEERIQKDGTIQRVTAAARIIELVKIGAYLETAAAAATVDRITLHRWLREGGKASARMAAGEPRHNLSRFQRLASDFYHGVAEAEAAHQVAIAARLDLLGRGGFTHTVVTTKEDAAGRVVETVTRVENLPPDGATERWRAERRYPHLYGRTDRVELTGRDGAPVEVEVTTAERRERVLAQLAEVADRMAAAHITDAELVGEDSAGEDS